MYYFTMANRIDCKDCLIVFVELTSSHSQVRIDTHSPFHFHPVAKLHDAACSKKTKLGFRSQAVFYTETILTTTRGSHTWHTGRPTSREMKGHRGKFPCCHIDSHLSSSRWCNERRGADPHRT